MYKALLVALIGLFFSFKSYATTECNIVTTDYAPVSTFVIGSGAFLECAEFYSGTPYTQYVSIGNSGCRGVVGFPYYVCLRDAPNNAPLSDRCTVNPSLSICSNDKCPDGSTPPNNSVANCPVNCDILSGGGGPDCDTEEPPNGYCSETQTPIFDDCQYSPDDPRNPDNQPDPEDHCEQFPDSVSCNTELPELPDTDFCKTYPNALSCQTPEIPDLGTDTNPPPAGGTGVGTDTGTGTGVTPPPPEPPPTNSDSPSASTDARLDSLRYDISRLHSGLNYQTGIIAAGLTGVAKQTQANGGKIDRSNTLLDGINKNLDVLNGGLKGDALTSGNFDVEGGINSALGITGNESIADLTDEPVTLESYREDFQPFLTTGQCPQNLPVALSLFGSNFNFVFYYQPVCDLMGIIGSILNWAVWLSVPFIVFGRRRAS